MVSWRFIRLFSVMTDEEIYCCIDEGFTGVWQSSVAI